MARDGYLQWKRPSLVESGRSLSAWSTMLLFANAKGVPQAFRGSGFRVHGCALVSVSLNQALRLSGRGTENFGDTPAAT